MKKASIILLSFLLVIPSIHICSNVINMIVSLISIITESQTATNHIVSTTLSLILSIILLGIFIAILSAHKVMKLKGASIAGAIILLIAAIIALIPTVFEVILTIAVELRTDWGYTIVFTDFYQTYTQSRQFVYMFVDLLYIIGTPLLVIPTKIPILGKIVMTLYNVLLTPLYLLSNTINNALIDYGLNISNFYIFINNSLNLLIMVPTLIILIVCVVKVKRSVDDSLLPTVVA